jgi:prepilin-type N-terminal cleavage/methylation domain-containing protein
MKNKNFGFTLVELSIVLIIIGLVAGGVLVGKELIHAAQLRSIITDAQRIELGIVTFQEKYNAYPGDMPNAEDIWGSDEDCPYTDPNTILKTETCNGNGDGLIRNMTTGTEYYEIFRAPQQLSNAGFITGRYSGVTGDWTSVFKTLAGINIPRLKSFNAGLFVLHNDPVASGDHMYFGGLRIMVHIGGDTSSWNYSPFLTPEEALYVDTKADNGKPGSGIWQTYKPASYPDPDPPPHCATTDDEDTAVYDLSHQQVKCALVYVIRRD